MTRTIDFLYYKNIELISIAVIMWAEHNTVVIKGKF